MNFKKAIIPFLFVLVLILFFYKSFFYGYLPFPGELLVSEYNPWKSYSYLGYNPGSIPSKVQYFDVIRQLYPWRSLAVDIFKTGEFPLWNPFNFAGTPLLANFQSSVFYPLNLFYSVFSKEIAWSILIIIQPLLASFFTYLFCREIKLSKISSIFSSIAFSYSLFMSVFLEYGIIGQTILWLPLILYLIEKLFKKKKIILIPIILTFSFFAGHIQLFFYLLFFSSAYFLFRWFQLGKNKKELIIFIFCLLVFLMLSAIQLLPTLELINLSARVSQNYQFLLEKLLIQPQELVLFLSPDFFGNPAMHNYLLSDSYPGNALYIGLIPFIFSILAILNFRNNVYTKFFFYSFVIIFIFIVRNPISEIFYRIQIPFFSTSSPNNSIFLISFSLALLSGFGMELLIKSQMQFKKIIFCLLTFFVSLWVFILIKHPVVSAKNFIYSTAILTIFSLLFFISLRFKNKKNIFLLIFTVITVFDLFYFFQKFNPFVDKSLIFPNTSIISYLQKNAGINRLWGYGLAEIPANFQTQFSLFSPDGYDPLYSKRFGELIQASKTGKIETEFNNSNRSDAIIAAGFGQDDLGKNLNRLKILDLLGVKYVLDRKENPSSEKTFPIGHFNLIHQEDGWRVFENTKAIPRMFLAKNYKYIKNKEDFENIFFEKNFNPLKTILLEEKINNFPLENIDMKEEKLDLISYKPQKVIAKTNTLSQNLLFISDNFYPGWKAFVDGKETKIYRANFVFRAIVIPKGEHEIEFRYNPYSFQIGLYITVFGIILLSTIFLLRKRLINEK
ncbi:hypothetical protein C4559_03200 [Candidatus Microgenomates bacterium]|nr:MAG: hypothetical protein C4559_03200 [Candidatus Microgenomates bacterium]